MLVAAALLSVLARGRIALWLSACALCASVAVAQTEPPKPAVKAPKKQQHTPPQPQPQAQPAPQPPPQAAAPAMPPLVYSNWTKICPTPAAGATAASQVCLIMKEARLETGQFVVGAAVIEQQGEAKKLLRITLPLGMQIPQGTRLTLDAEQPAPAIYVTCIPNGCMADYEINPAYIERMKKGQQLVLQGVSMAGQVSRFTMPLAEFGKAADGPPTE